MANLGVATTVFNEFVDEGIHNSRGRVLNLVAPDLSFVISLDRHFLSWGFGGVVVSAWNKGSHGLLFKEAGSFFERNSLSKVGI